jgi:hypothetical protein
MSDEKFEEFIKREAGAYQTPPAVTPRDEMWTVIAEARARRGAAGPISLTGMAGTPRHPGLRRLAPWIGMAATLLVGVGIGKYAMQGGPATQGTEVAAGTLPSTTPSTTGLPAGTNPASADPSQTLDPAAASASAPATDVGAPPRSVPAPRGTPVRLASNGAVIVAPSPMQVASREHLARAEALISVVAATPADAVMDSLTGRWAREMLTSTRLLLDSPAGDDPARRRLFEDLEMVLVQLVQRSGTSADERQLIDRSLQRTQLLTRLRTSATGI